MTRLLRSTLLVSSLLLGALALGLSCVHQLTPSSEDGGPDAKRELPVIEDGPWTDPQLPPEQRVRLVLAEMTREEKFRLLFGYFGNAAPWQNYVPPPQARFASAGYVPGVPRLGIPAQWQADAGIGVATQGGDHEKRARTALPSGLSVAATWNPSVSEAGGVMIGEEARSSGFNVMLAGSVNLLRDAYNGRNFEYAGEDPWLAGSIVAAAIRGIQSNHIISTAKHFAVNDQETDRKGSNSILDDAAARMSDLLAFEFAIEAGRPGAVMCAYNKLNGVYSCENPYLLREVLRQDWRFDGYVMSDWGATHSAAAAANAGLEQETGWPFDEKPYFQEPLERDLAAGKVSPARIDEMAARILHSMFRLGLFEHPVSEGEVDLAAHAPVTQAAAEEGIVLLKNEAQLLPLADAPGCIALIGGHADKGVLSGGGSSQVYPPGENAVPGLEPLTWPGPVVYYPSSPLAELQKLLPRAELTFATGEDVPAAVALAKRCGTAIVFATQWATESIDTSLVLPHQQDALIAAVAAATPRSVVVLETGGPVLMPWADRVGAILMAWYPGSEGGRAIARILSGQVNPSGHLPLTLPRSAQDLAHPQPPRAGDVRYTEGASVGYKWFDQRGIEPLFAFGHGLSYSVFEHTNLDAKLEAGIVVASFTVKNVGERPGKDVAQVYVSGPGWEAPKRLGAYSKVDLAPGAEATLRVRVDPRLLAVWSSAVRAWKIAPGEYEVLLGRSARDLVSRVRISHPGSVIPAGGAEQGL